MGQALSVLGQDEPCCGDPLRDPRQKKPGEQKPDEILVKMRTTWGQKNVVSLKMFEYSATDHADGINHLCERQGGVVYINFCNARGLAPLHLAARVGAAAAARALLFHGADPALKTSDGFTAAQLARSSGHIELAEDLHRAAGGGGGALRRNSGLGTPQQRSARLGAGALDSPLSDGRAAARELQWPAEQATDAHARALPPPDAGARGGGGLDGRPSSSLRARAGGGGLRAVAGEGGGAGAGAGAPGWEPVGRAPAWDGAPVLSNPPQPP